MSTPQAERQELRFVRRYPVACEKVWRAWTDPQALSAWFGPGEPHSVLVAELDVRVGGRYRIRFRTQDGEQHEVGGRYEEVQPQRKLVFSWAWRTTPERVSRVTVEMRPDADGTLLDFLHERFVDAQARANHERGWTGTFAKLDAWLASASTKEKAMFENAEVLATAAVRDLARARAFYEGKLEFKPVATESQMASYRCGAGTLLLYESQLAGTNQATAATFDFKAGLEGVVQALRAKGVRFEHYELPDTVREGDIHRGHGRSVAWCKDPDGNILCLAQEG